MAKDINGRAITYDKVTRGGWLPYDVMEPTLDGDYVDTFEYRELEEVIKKLKVTLEQMSKTK